MNISGPNSYSRQKKLSARELAERFQDLPADLRNRVIQGIESLYIKNTIVPPREDLDVSIVKELIKRWDAAPDWKKRNAEARREILDASKTFAGSRKLTSQKRKFCNLYRVHNNGLGISESTFERFSEISLRTLYRWEDNYQEQGMVGLLDDDKARPRSVFTQEMETYMTGLIGRNPNIRPVRVGEYLTNKFGVKLSPRTVREKVKNIKSRQEQAFTLLDDPDRWRSEYQVAFGNAAESARYFLHQVELDTTPGDVDLKGKRHKIIAGIDRFCRKAKTNVSPVGGSEAIAGVIRRISIEWGIVTEFIFDLGKDYMSRHIEIALKALGIKRSPTPGYTPEAKPFVERYFRTLGNFFEEFEEFTGHNVSQAKKIRKRHALIKSLMTEGEVIKIDMEPEEFQRRLDHYNDYIYSQKTHRGLGKSPEAKAAESPEPVRKIEDERILDLLLAKAGSRVVGKKGIEFNGGTFVAPELWRYVKQRVEVRQDVHNAGRLYVFDEATKAFICVARDAALEPFTAEEATQARKEQRHAIREQAKALLTLAKPIGDPLADLLESKRNEPGQIRAFHRVEKAEGGMIEEAGRALKAEELEAARTWIKSETDQKIASFGNEAPFFEDAHDRYKWLKEQANSRRLTAQEREFMAEFEETELYQMIYVWPFEEGSG
jgi:transposase